MYLYYTGKKIGKNGQTYGGEEAKSGGVYVLGTVPNRVPRTVDGVSTVRTKSNLFPTPDGQSVITTSVGTLGQFQIDLNTQVGRVQRALRLTLHVRSGGERKIIIRNRKEGTILAWRRT
jgi:hypothetical protein